MYRTIIAAGALLAFTACADKGDSGDTAPGGDDTAGEDSAGETGGDTAYYKGPVVIDAAGGACDKKGWFYDVQTAGLSSAGDLWIEQTGAKNGWNEYHPLPVVDAGDWGYWTDLYLELGYVFSTGDVVEGETTLFGCDGARKASLTWLVYVYDDTGAYADCVAWGDDTSYFAKDCKNSL